MRIVAPYKCWNRHGRTKTQLLTVSGFRSQQLTTVALVSLDIYFSRQMDTVVGCQGWPIAWPPLADVFSVRWNKDWLIDWLVFNSTFSTVRLYRAFIGTRPSCVWWVVVPSFFVHQPHCASQPRITLSSALFQDSKKVRERWVTYLLPVYICASAQIFSFVCANGDICDV